MKSLGELVMEANIEEIALTSLRLQGLEEENERLKARVAELEERLFHLEGRGKSDLEKRIDAFLEQRLPQLDEPE